MRLPLRHFVMQCAAVLVLSLDGPVAAAEADYARVNAALAAHHVLPRYSRLAAATAAFDRSVGALCRRKPPRELDQARASFGAAMDAWMAIEHVQHGPVELFMRKFRIHFWPDKGGRSNRQIRELLSQRDDTVLTHDTFRSASVAVQGFPTAERLLFNDAPARMIATGADGDFPCRLLAAVAYNLADMARGMADDWGGGATPFIDEVRRAGGTDSRFETHKEATAAFVKGLYAALQAMTDYKLDRPLGKTIEAARPKLSESWRSGRSLQNIVRNLEALQAMYDGEGGPGLKTLLRPDDREFAALLSRAFARTLATARSIDRPLARAVGDPMARGRVAQLAKEVRALKTLVSDRLAPALRTPLGFNALDGD